VTSSGPRPAYATDGAIRDFVAAALKEDIGGGDHSTLSAIDASAVASANLHVKANGILAGIELAEAVFHQYDAGLKVNLFRRDGDAIANGEIAFMVTGAARSILSTERIVLNCMQRMSGIATYTRHLSRLIEGTGAQLTDTRKTTPGFRLAEKWAVFIGGARNHRFALYDMIMLKDNHVDLGGGVAKALRSAVNYRTAKGKNLRIEVETRNLAEVGQALEAGGADIIMLDNMSVPEILKAVDLIGNRAETEASGGITEANIRAIAETGVNYISVGALTHSARSLDLSLKVVRN
jgi:nicotinate-nucleotide pyrophosphorylase (carboxylating)